MVWFKVIVIGTSVTWRRDYERQIRTTGRKRGQAFFLFLASCIDHRRVLKKSRLQQMNLSELRAPITH